MDFSIQNNSNLQDLKSDSLIIGVTTDGEQNIVLSKFAKELDNLSNGYVSSLIADGSLTSKFAGSLLLHHIPNMSLKKVLIINCGQEDKFTLKQYQQVMVQAISQFNQIGVTHAICNLAQMIVKDELQNLSFYWKIRHAIVAVLDSLYTFDHFKSEKLDKAKEQPLLQLVFTINKDGFDLDKQNKAIGDALAIAKGVALSKDLGNLPPNIVNPAYLAQKAQDLATNYQNITTSIVDEKAMATLNMTSYLAVGQGSHNKSLMSVIEYKGSSSSDKPIVLIGKGLTFDSGGISLKPGAGMDEMKYDMCGAASVFGTMQALAEMQLPINVVGILAGCENMPDGNAYRPGDILTTMSGQTVEVLNTDAEGRLVLCDVLTYAQRFDPECVIDVATLTGACVIALGHHITGVMANNNTLASELVAASEQAADRAWHLPMSDEYDEQLKSPFADMGNVGGREGGAITAACFLARFAREYNWAHLDIAGTAWRSKANKGSTGRPVGMLTQFLLNKAAKKQ